MGMTALDIKGMQFMADASSDDNMVDIINDAEQDADQAFCDLRDAADKLIRARERLYALCPHVDAAWLHVIYAKQIKDRIEAMIEHDELIEP